MRIAIIGGGASGLMCGAYLAQHEIYATIFDGNDKLGKKIYITGKGRCNLTNVCMPNEFLENVVNGKKFLFSAINRFSSFDCINFFEENGLKIKIERGQRAFPESDKASDVTKVLQKLNSKNIISLNEEILKIEKQDNKFFLTTSKGQEEFDIIVIATGGKSYPLTGSKGQGYELASNLGHKITEPKPALVAIELKDKFISTIQGLPLKNVKLHAKFKEQNKEKEISLFGEMMFTDKGITGPIVLSMSSLINRAKEINLFIDFKPALTKEQLNARLLREFENNKNKNISNIMHGLLPKNFVDVFLERVKISACKKVNEITKEERENIIENLKKFDLTYKQLYPIESGIVTSGGAFSTGYACGEAIANKIMKEEK